MKKTLILLIYFMSNDAFGQVNQKKNPNDFLPKGFVIKETIKGDLNKDGVEDCIFLIKGTVKNKFFKDKYNGLLDRNRRGLIILFNKKQYFELAIINQNCFSSENEDGGVYFAPDLSVQIEKGSMIVHYGHGRYGYWTYRFRHKNGNFELIGYDESNNRGPVVQSFTSINFLTKKKLTRDNLNKDKEGNEVYIDNFKDTWSSITARSLLKLSNINDFDELDLTKY